MPTLGRKAYGEIRRMLLEGEIPPGTQLVNRKLAEDIGISMTPVREAINRLASEGLVEQIPGSGAFARKVSGEELSHLFEIREALEPMAAARAAVHASDFDILELRQVVASGLAIVREIAASPMRRASAKQAKRWAAHEQRLHETIFGAARNPWLAKISRDLYLMEFGFSRQREMPDILTVELAVATWKAHRRLIRAIARRDRERASALMLEHIQSARNDRSLTRRRQPLGMAIARTGRPPREKRTPACRG